MNKESNGIVILLMGIIIIILALLCVLFATDTLTITTKNENETTSDKTNTKSENTDKITTNNDINSEAKTEDKFNDNNTSKKFTFNTSYGTETIEAEEALTGRGSAGASSKIFYLKGHKLYLYGHGESDELLADGVDKIYYKTEQTDLINVVLNSNSTISKENSYIKYEK